MKKILVVDDSPTMRNLIKAGLQGKPFEVVTAQDGDKAVKIVNSEKLDMIITDINMPNMNGIEFIENVRKGTSENKNLPVLVISTEGGDSIKSSGRIAGASGWIVKPFKPEVLISAVERLLSK